MGVPINMIVACDERRGIGKAGRMPWQLSADMKYFKAMTTKTVDPHKKNAVLMGRVTWQSIPEKFRPLTDRLNIVLSRNESLDLNEGVMRFSNFDDALNWINLSCSEIIEQVFIIGGAQIYQQVLSGFHIDKLYMTHILDSFDCDVFFPEYLHHFKQVACSDELREHDVAFCFAQYEFKD